MHFRDVGKRVGIEVYYVTVLLNSSSHSSREEGGSAEQVPVAGMWFSTGSYRCLHYGVQYIMH